MALHGNYGDTKTFLMSALAFDTHAAVKKLREAGFTEQQAEAQTTLLVEVISGELATQRDIETLRLDIENVRAELKRDIETLRLDIENVRAELKRDLENVRAELKHDIETLRLEIENVRAELKRDLKELELRLTIKLGAMLALAVGAMATLVKLL